MEACRAEVSEGLQKGSSDKHLIWSAFVEENQQSIMFFMLQRGAYPNYGFFQENKLSITHRNYQQLIALQSVPEQECGGECTEKKEETSNRQNQESLRFRNSLELESFLPLLSDEDRKKQVV